MPDPVKRKLVVTACEFKTSGTNKNGEWKLYELGVTGEDGQPIDANFTSFQDLAGDIGDLVEYEVTFHDHDRYGRTYTLKKPQGKLGPRVQKLEEEMAELVKRIEQLESRLEPATAAGGSKDDDDIPF